MIEPAPRTDAPRFCPACRRGSDAFLPAASRPAARCPECQALERHRFLALLIDVLQPWIRQRVRVVADVAPTPIISNLLADRVDPWLTVGLDLSADRRVDVRADLTALPLADASVDLLVCYHVLEHVPDDRAAMRELARVLAPAGLALVQVPRHLDEVTDDGPLVDPEHPTHRFGQDDHVRWYGLDFEDRLRACGLAATTIGPPELCSVEEITTFGLQPREEVWLVRRADASHRPGGGHHDLLRAMLAGQQEARRLAADRERVRAEREAVRGQRDDANRARERERRGAREEISELRESLHHAERRAEDFRSAYERLAAHPVVRALRRLKAAARRLRK